MVGNGLDRGARLHVAGGIVIPLGFAVQTLDSTTPDTRIGLQRTGVADVYIDGTVTTGDLVVVSPTTANRVRRMDTGGPGGGFTAISYQEWFAVIGRALESGTNGQQIKVALTLG